MKKILIISNTFSEAEGGATAIAFEQARSLKERGFDVSVFAGDFQKAYTETDKLGIKIFKIKIKNTNKYIFRSWLSMRNFRVEKEFKKYLKNQNFDAIHFHNLYYQMPFSLMKIAKKHCQKIFFTAHDVMAFSGQKLSFFANSKLNLENIDQVDYRFSFWRQLKQDKKAFNPFRNFYIMSCLKRCTKILTVSRELEKALNQNKIANTTTVHNGIDKEKWIADPEKVQELKEKFNLNGKKVLLFAGRLSGQKGGQAVLEMLSRVKQKIPNVVLVLLGGDEKYFKKIEEIVVNLEIEKNVIWAGKVSRVEMKKYYRSADLTLVPSIYLDPFPTVNLESIASGTPLVSTIFGGSREIIKNQKNGLLVNPLDTNNFVGSVIEFLTKNNLEVDEGDLEEFTQEKWIEKIIYHYENL